MRTTVDLPEDLVRDAMEITKLKTKTAVLKTALMNLIQKEKISGIKNFQGKVDLSIDLETLRKR